jgi:hypothetical protein
MTASMMMLMVVVVVPRDGGEYLLVWFVVECYCWID